MRALFLGQIGSSTTAWGLLATVGLAAAGMLLGARTFQRESA